jgi:hypothetical protein
LEPPGYETLPPEDYAYLFGLYLGDGWIAAIGARTFSLRISCDQRYPEIIAAAARAMAAVNPGKRIRIWRRANSDAVVASFWVRWPMVFPQHGPGPKHARAIVMEDWPQRITTRHPDSFIGGLIHSDGCRYLAIRVARQLRGSESRNLGAATVSHGRVPVGSFRTSTLRATSCACRAIAPAPASDR